MNNMAFNPVGGLTDSSAYPTAPATEAAARTQIQDPSNQLRDFINTNFVGIFNAQSLSSSGYQKLPSGLIIQWFDVTNPNSDTGSVNFPISFPNQVFQVLACVGSGGTATKTVCTAQTNSNVTWYANFTVGIGQAIRFIAIGY